MKKLLFFLSLIFLAFPNNILAYQQTEAVCYSQCAAYKFLWKGDFCMDLFTNQCSISSKDALTKTIGLVKDTAQAMATGELSMIVGVTDVFKGMFLCKPLIDECIVPQLNACLNTCKNISQTYYAPNLSVGNPNGSIAYQNVYYDEARHQLTFKVTNDGGYAWDIDVTASWGHTPNRDKLVSGGGTLFTEKIPELLFFGARIGSPKTPGDYVTDFLIEESNFSSFLSRFKSDANNHYIPPAWYKTIPFTAPDGEYTKVILNVDPNQMIPEASEGDNTYILEIDQLPTPVSLSVENLTYRRTNPTSLTEYQVSFDLKNSGQESGNAHVKWYAGKYEAGKNPIHEQNMVVQGLNKVSFDHILNVDVTNGGDSCNSTQKYTLVAFDDAGFIKTTHEFYLPLYAGSVTGQVEDLFGKKVVGATVTASTGQTASVNDSGYYHIKGIPTLGKVTLTATHPEFSAPQTQEVNIEFNLAADKCHTTGLSHDGVDFVLKDQDVIFTVILKDASGNLINGHVLATNKVSDNADISNQNFRLDKDINGTGDLGALQPGEYLFTISAGNYKTMSQTVSAVPNNQNLEFILAPISGRNNDGSIVIGPPQLLWQWDRGVEILSQIAATKDGNRVMLYTSRNKPDTGKLYFFDTLTGNRLKVVSTPATGGNSKSCLSTSYDGNTTALLVHNGVPGISKGKDNSLILFDANGNEFVRNDQFSGGGIGDCSVSPDGFYLYPGFLINKSLYAYSRLEIEGVGGYSHQGYSSLGPVYFLHGNGLIARCKDGDDQCSQYVNGQEIMRFTDLSGSVRVVDSSFNDQRVIFAGYDKLQLYAGGGKVFEKEVNASGREPSASISMGGQYAIYTHNDSGVHNADFKIVTADNVEKTPNYTKDPNQDVIFVHANDKGLFYLAKHGTRLSYYQVGKYTTEYTAPTPLPTAKPETTTSGLSVYSDGRYSPSRPDQTFANLEEGVIYVANRNVKLDMGNSNGSLSILDETVFSIDANHRPILLRGQLTADFSSPAIIYALKFDRFNMELFRTKLNQFRSGTLPASDYFIVKNTHTKFTVRNGEGNFNVSVENGQVNVLADKTEKFIDSGRQITIDKDNKIQESVYISPQIYVIIIGVLFLISGILLFVYRKTKVVLLLWRTVKIVAIWKWNMLKRFSRFLLNRIKKKSPAEVTK